MKNWRTTVTGASVSGLVVANQIYQATQGQNVDWSQLVIAALFTVFSYLAKDAGVTGEGR